MSQDLTSVFANNLHHFHRLILLSTLSDLCYGGWGGRGQTRAPPLNSREGQLLLDCHSISLSFPCKLFFFLAMPHGLQDLSSPTKDWTWTMAVKVRILTTWPWGTLFCKLLKLFTAAIFISSPFILFLMSCNLSPTHIPRFTDHQDYLWLYDHQIQLFFKCVTWYRFDFIDHSSVFIRKSSVFRTFPICLHPFINSCYFCLLILLASLKYRFSGKASTCQCKRCGFDPWVWKFTWNPL